MFYFFTYVLTIYTENFHISHTALASTSPPEIKPETQKSAEELIVKTVSSAHIEVEEEQQGIKYWCHVSKTS
jgi:hypothetical protein